MKPRCPLVRIADQARKASVNVLRATRRLRRSAAACQACPRQASCIQRAAFNAEIDGLIAEISEQWQSAEDMVEPCQRLPKSVETDRLCDGRR